jgi:hypothetical protein
MGKFSAKKPQKPKPVPKKKKEPENFEECMEGKRIAFIANFVKY